MTYRLVIRWLRVRAAPAKHQADFLFTGSRWRTPITLSGGLGSCRHGIFGLVQNIRTRDMVHQMQQATASMQQVRRVEKRWGSEQYAIHR
jgi:hypothetical protein